MSQNNICSKIEAEIDIKQSIFLPVVIKKNMIFANDMRLGRRSIN